MKKSFLLISIFFLFFSCDSSKEKEKKCLKAQYITRSEDTIFCPIYPPQENEKEIYPWELEK